MGEVQSLSGAEALKKIKDLAENNVLMFGTFSGNRMLTRPMHVQGIDEDGSFWFFSGKDSDKNREIQQNPKVHLIYADNKSNEYLSIEGTAEVNRDQGKIDELWSAWAKTWFQGGKTDPNLTLIRVIPEEGYYWDTKNNKMVSLAKIAIGAMIGKTMDDGVEGKLGLDRS